MAESVMGRLRRLDEERKQLLGGARDEALERVNSAIEELRELGFNYRLVQDNADMPVARRQRQGGGGRGEKRNAILDLIKERGGLTRGELIDLMDARNDRAAQQSISNALSAMKKQGQLNADGGRYTAA